MTQDSSLSRRLRVVAHVILVTALVLTACTDATEELAARTTTTRPGDTGLPTTTTTAAAEPVSLVGVWLAEIGLAVLQFRLDEDSDGEVNGVFDSPAEGVTDIPAIIRVDGTDVSINIPRIGALFKATVTSDTLSGTWFQSGQEIPMEFERRAEPIAYDRPQEPQPPFPYTSTDVEFRNGSFDLAGTLVVPDGDGPFPAVVLVSGSGPQDRDESLLGHKPFLVLADTLARAGIASVRYDDRGVGQSGGDFVGATTQDLATDAAAAVTFLANTPDVGHIGIVGHSEGGLIAPLVAADAAEVDFVVLLAGPGVPGAEVLLRQFEDLQVVEGTPDDVVAWQVEWYADVIAVAASDVSAVDAESRIRQRMEEAAADAPAGAGDVAAEIDLVVESFIDPWMRWFPAYDPAPALQRLDVPVLALIGDLDLQVSAEVNLPALEGLLADTPDATIAGLPGLNHLFQPATTGAVSEYASIETTFDPDTLDLIAGWILGRF